MEAPRLNAMQAEAVSYTDGPLLIVAGAGTGKTTVITEKIVQLIETGAAKPEEILALTFTDKAAEEMEHRVDARLSAGYTDLQISTFHTFAQRLLQDHGLAIGLSPSAELLTQTDAWLLVQDALHDFSLEYYKPLGNPVRHIHALIGHVSKCKDECVSPETYATYAAGLPENSPAEKEEKEREQEIANFYADYTALLRKKDKVDFGDLLYYAVALLEKRAAVQEFLQKRYKYILVDEFQDVNWAQYRLVQLLTGEQTQLTVVGDDDQSIYAFRGASVANIMRFHEDYPKAKHIVLTENYRSGQKILDTAYTSIQHNNPDRLEEKLQIDKALKSHKKGEVSVIHLHRHALHEEVQAVAEEIAHIKESNANLTWDDFAILVRANNHATPFLQGLEARGIPYEFLASSGLYRQPLVMDVLSFLKVVDNVKDSQSIYHLLRLPVAALKENDIQKITQFAKKKTISYYEALKRTKEIGCSTESTEAADKLLQAIHSGVQAAKTEKPHGVVYGFLEESGYLAYLTKEEEEGNAAVIRQIHQLTTFFELLEAYEQAVPEAHVHRFLAYYEQLRASGDEGSLYQPSDTPDSVNILTIHASKGLEFRYVFVVNMVDDRFPSRRRGGSIPFPDALAHEPPTEADTHIQEERRLFYVAATRAKERLYFVSSDDYGGVRKKKISRFLSELDFVAGVQNQGKTSALPEKKAKAKEQEMHYDVPKAFSFSQIKAYQTCPYQYKLAHILKIPSKGHASFSFGQTMHLAMQHFYTKMQEMNAAKQVSLFDAPQQKPKEEGIKVPSFAELLEIYENTWIPDWYKDKEQRQLYYQKGKEILQLFYRSHEGNWRIPVALESWFKIKVGDATIRGRIDRVDQQEDGSLEIIDYKTGKTKERLTSEDKEQLLIYQIAAETLPAYRHIGETKKLTFLYLNDNVELSFVGKPAELEKLKEKLGNTIGRIQSGDFAPTPGQFVCSYCDFREICRHRAV